MTTDQEFQQPKKKKKEKELLLNSYRTCALRWEMHFFSILQCITHTHSQHSSTQIKVKEIFFSVYMYHHLIA